MQWKPASSKLQEYNDEVDNRVREYLTEKVRMLARTLCRFLNAILKLHLGFDRSGCTSKQDEASTV